MPIVVETPKFRARDLIEFRGYSQAAISFLNYGVAIGAVYFVVGPLLAGMEPDVKWPLGVVSSAILVRGLLGILVSPITGWLVDRVGVRPIVIIGGITTAGFTALTGLVTNPWEFGIVFGVALAVADAFYGFIPAATIVHNWFMDRRAVMMGLVNAGAGFGGLVFAPVMAVLVAHFGWRHALFYLGLIIFVLAVPSLFVRTKPADVNQWVDGVEGRVIPKHGDEDAIGTPQSGVRKALRSPIFWMVFFVFGIEAWALGVYAADQVIYLKTVGIDAVQASSAIGIAAGIAAVSGIVFSRLSDRISPYYVLIAATTSMLVGSIIFVSTRSVGPLYAYSAFFGAGYGLLVPTIPVAISRYFGALDFSKAFGFGQILSALMGGLGPFVTGIIADHVGFRIPIYLIVGLLALSVLIAALARPPKFALRPIVVVDPEAKPETPAVEPTAEVPNA